jgi:hypothetical protein
MFIKSDSTHKSRADSIRKIVQALNESEIQVKKKSRKQFKKLSDAIGEANITLLLTSIKDNNDRNYSKSEYLAAKRRSE